MCFFAALPPKLFGHDASGRLIKLYLLSIAMMQFFQFEADYVNSLRCIPMQVRYKLDTCGVKLKLSHWNHLNQNDRQTLVQLPCETATDIQAYRDFLQQLVLERTGTIAAELAIDPAPAWLDTTTISTAVQQQAEAFEVNLTPEQWATLTPLQRFALIKLSRTGHENANFFPALAEFHLNQV